MLKLIRRLLRRKKPVAQAEGRDWNMAVIHGWGEEIIEFFVRRGGKNK